MAIEGEILRLRPQNDNMDSSTEEVAQLGNHDWPDRLQMQIATALGPTVSVERLSGMSLSGVWRVRGTNASLIVKTGPSPTEARFYEDVAPSLRAEGIPIPALELALAGPDANWLVIEDIPDPLPVSPGDWQPDTRIVTILARLHATTRASPPKILPSQRQSWTDAMTQATRSYVPDVDPLILDRIRHESQTIFEPWCWISGDPNPRNWGLRADGSPVLFDWELFGPGRPATDLAIIIPGLGDAAAYTRVATAYHTAWEGSESLPWDINNLARQIAGAKVVTVVQLLDGHITEEANVGEDLLVWLTKALPGWLGSVHDIVTTGRS